MTKRTEIPGQLDMLEELRRLEDQGSGASEQAGAATDAVCPCSPAGPSENNAP